MGREIKFRAWCTNSNGSHMEYDITIVNGKYADVEGGWDIQGLMDFPIMQYTGLKDKNGKKIYEGDILKVSGKATKGTFTLNVYWGLGEFYVADHPDRYFSGMAEFSQSGRGAEVIGNIYENPELLKEVEK